jgi:hypothetical protein
VKTKQNKTPLHTAAQDGNMLSVLLILQISQDKNLEDKIGWTPLHYAAHSVLIVNIILCQKCDISLMDNYGVVSLGQTPDISSKKGYYILSISRPPKRILYPILYHGKKKDMDIYPISFAIFCRISLFHFVRLLPKFTFSLSPFVAEFNEIF